MSGAPLVEEESGTPLVKEESGTPGAEQWQNAAPLPNSSSDTSDEEVSVKGCGSVSVDSRPAFDSKTSETSENVPGAEQWQNAAPLPTSSSDTSDEEVSVKGCGSISVDSRPAFNSRTPETSENVPGAEQWQNAAPLPTSSSDTSDEEVSVKGCGSVSVDSRPAFDSRTPETIENVPGAEQQNAAPLQCKTRLPQGKAQQISSRQEGGGANNTLVYQYQKYGPRMRVMSQSSRVWSLLDVCRDGFPECSTFKSLPPGAIIYGDKVYTHLVLTYKPTQRPLSIATRYIPT